MPLRDRTRSRRLRTSVRDLLFPARCHPERIRGTCFFFPLCHPRSLRPECPYGTEPARAVCERGVRDLLFPALLSFRTRRILAREESAFPRPLPSQAQPRDLLFPFYIL